MDEPVETQVRSAREERLLALEMLAERKAADPLQTWQPTVKQRPFITYVESGGPMAFFVAANRSGKTAAGAYLGAKMARYGREPAHAAYSSGGRVEVRERATAGWVVSLDFRQSQES